MTHPAAPSPSDEARPIGIPDVMTVQRLGIPASDEALKALSDELSEGGMTFRQSARTYLANNGWGDQRGVSVIRSLLVDVERLQARVADLLKECHHWHAHYDAAQANWNEALKERDALLKARDEAWHERDEAEAILHSLPPTFAAGLLVTLKEECEAQYKLVEDAEARIRTLEQEQDELRIAIDPQAVKWEHQAVVALAQAHAQDSQDVDAAEQERDVNRRELRRVKEGAQADQDRRRQAETTLAKVRALPRKQASIYESFIGLHGGGASSRQAVVIEWADLSRLLDDARLNQEPPA